MTKVGVGLNIFCVATFGFNPPKGAVQDWIAKKTVLAALRR